METLIKQDLFDTIENMPKALYNGGLYMQYDMGGLWHCGYDKSVYHTCDKDLKVALNDLLMKLKESGYYETLGSKR